MSRRKETRNSKEYWMTISRIREQAKAHNLRANEIAAYSGVHPTTVATALRGERWPFFKTVAKIAEAVDAIVTARAEDRKKEIPTPVRARYFDELVTDLTEVGTKSPPLSAELVGLIESEGGKLVHYPDGRGTAIVFEDGFPSYFLQKSIHHGLGRNMQSLAAFWTE